MLSTNIERDFALVFILEHILWAVFIVLQWLVLRYAAARIRPARKWVLLAAALSVISVLAGVVSWMERWPLVHGEGISWNILDRAVAIFGLALVPPAWLLLHRRYHRAGSAETLRRSGIRWLSAASAASFLVILCWFAIATARPGSWLFALAYRDELQRSQIAIEAVEVFRRLHGRLPDSLQEAGLPLEQFDERCPCYYRQTEQSYIVSFGYALGESVVYDSVSGQWQY